MVNNKIAFDKKDGTFLDWRQCGNSLALCYFAVVMVLPDSLWMNYKSKFGVVFLRCSFWFWFILRRAHLEHSTEV